MTHPPFPGFRPEAFTFLNDLKHHNNRDWFKPRKTTYEDELKWPLECLVADLSREAPAQGLTLTGDPKKALFRIYRDTRFSKNKAPYKTHLGAVLSRSGHKRDPGGFYIHIEPENTFFAAGFWRPDGPLLRAWRTRMVEDPEGFLHLTETLEQAGLPLTRPHEMLKRLPRGFESYADTPVADDLRRKSYVTMRKVDHAEAHDPAFTQAALKMMRDTYPLLTYGWEIVDAP